MTTKKFKKIVWDYYEKNGRHELPWRLNLDPYVILVSEVMLQQTQVERVIPKFNDWLKRFPTFAKLAHAPLPDVLVRWQGLGYNRRALALQRCAQAVEAQYGGALPRTREALLDLPGVGSYTASAIAAFAFNQPVVMIETNIRTVFIHHWLPKKENVEDNDLIPLVEKTVDSQHTREWYWALMDYGSFLKKQHGNASRRSRHYVRQSAFTGSNREVRGAIIRTLTKTPTLKEQALLKQLQEAGINSDRIAPALMQLTQEGFIIRDLRQKKIMLQSSVTAKESEWQ